MKKKNRIKSLVPRRLVSAGQQIVDQWYAEEKDYDYSGTGDVMKAGTWRNTRYLQNRQSCLVLFFTIRSELHAFFIQFDVSCVG